MKEETMTRTHYLTAEVSTSYASNRGSFMSVDAPIHPEIKTDATMKIEGGKLNEEKKGGLGGLFFEFFRKRQKAAKEWEEYLKKDLKGKTFDQNRLKEMIFAGILPSEWKDKYQQAGDVKEKVARPENVKTAWEKHQAEKNALPADVAKRMEEEDVLPAEVVKLHEEQNAHISPAQKQVLDIVCEATSGKLFKDLPPAQQKEIAHRIASGASPSEAIFQTIIALPQEKQLGEEVDRIASEQTEELSAYQRHMYEQLVEGRREVRSDVPDVFKNAFTDETKDFAPVEAQVTEEEAAEIRDAWREHLGEDDWENQDTRSTVEMMSWLGIMPEQSRRGDDKPTAQEVFENARLTADLEQEAARLEEEGEYDLAEEKIEEAKDMRFAKAAELLGLELPKIEDLPEEEQEKERKKQELMKNTLWEAHMVGGGEEGKFGGEAGIYNYTLAHLREKYRILVEEEEDGENVWSKDQAEKLNELGLAGRVSIDPTMYNPASYEDPRAQELARYVGRRIEDGTIDDRVLRQASESADESERRGIVDSSVRTTDEMRALIDQVNRDVKSRVTAKDPGEQDREIRSNLRLYLLEPELDLLAKNNGEGAIEWLNSQFDTIFKGSSQGQELDSPTLRQLENKVAYAISYLNYSFADRPDIAEKFLASFSIRQKLMVMRVVIGQRNTESLQGAAGQLRMHGVMSSFGFEDQNVRRIYTRMNEKLDEMRLNMRDDLGGYEKKVTAEMVQTMRQNVEAEEVRLFEALAKENLEATHPLWDTVKHVKASRDNETDKDAQIREIKNSITRTSRMAYDLFVATQREAIIIARGRNPADDSVGYRSVPSGVFSFLNPEAMMWGGWDMKNAEALEFYDRIKIDIAEEALTRFRGHSKDALNRLDKIEYGERLIRELSTIGDFFSSGWRSDIYKKQIEELMIFKVMAEPTIARWRGRYDGITNAQIKDLLHGLPINLNGDAAGALDPETNTELKKELAELQKRFSERGKSGDSAVQEGKDLAEQFGLYLQLKEKSGGRNGVATKENEKNRKEAEEIWGKIAAQKPEEIIKWIKDRLPIRKEAGHGSHSHDRPEWKTQLNKSPGHWHDELDPLQRKLAEVMGYDPQQFVPTETELANGSSAFDQFREDFGPVITLLRENAMREDKPRIVDLTNLKPEERKLVENAGITDIKGNKLTNAADRLQRGYEAMQEYIRTHTIEDGITKKRVGVTRLLVQDYRFDDIYQRVIAVDDIFQDELEDPPAITGLKRVSDIVSTEPGGDGYRRTMNDAMDGIKAMGGLYKFITQEKPEAKMEGAMEYASALGSANGQEDIARAMRFTYGSYLDLSKPYFFMDVAGVKRLGNIPISEIQKIYGPEAHVMEREEIRRIIDTDLRFMLASSIGKKELQDRILYEKGVISAEDVEHRRHQYHEETSLFLNSLKERTGSTSMDIYKQRAIQAAVFLVLLLLGASMTAVSAVALEQSTGGQGGGGGGGGHH